MQTWGKLVDESMRQSAVACAKMQHTTVSLEMNARSVVNAQFFDGAKQMLEVNAPCTFDDIGLVSVMIVNGGDETRSYELECARKRLALAALDNGGGWHLQGAPHLSLRPS